MIANLQRQFFLGRHSRAFLIGFHHNLINAHLTAHVDSTFDHQLILGFLISRTTSYCSLLKPIPIQLTKYHTFSLSFSRVILLFCPLVWIRDDGSLTPDLLLYLTGCAEYTNTGFISAFEEC